MTGKHSVLRARKISMALHKGQKQNVALNEISAFYSLFIVFQRIKRSKQNNSGYGENFWVLKTP